MTASIRGVTRYLKLPLINFNSANWHDADNTRMEYIDAAIGVLAGSFSGLWDNDTLYAIGERVLDPITNEVYVVLVQHTTDDTVLFSAYRTAHPTYYRLFNAGPRQRGTFDDNGVSYAVTELVSSEDNTKMAIVVNGFTTVNGVSTYNNHEAAGDLHELWDLTVVADVATLTVLADAVSNDATSASLARDAAANSATTASSAATTATTKATQASASQVAAAASAASAADSAATVEDAAAIIGDAGATGLLVIAADTPAAVRSASGSLASEMTGPALLGRDDATLGAVETITLGNGLSMAAGALVAAAKPFTRQLITASGTWNRPAGCKAIEVWSTGGGGGGGAADGGGSLYAGGAGGGAGGTCYSYIDVTAVASVAVTIGSGGAAAGSLTGGSGTSGGTTSFGAYHTAGGGGGGTGTGSAGGTTEAARTPGTGGTAIGGDINMKGGAGRRPSMQDSSTHGWSGEGGRSFWGPGGAELVGATSSVGNPGVSYGSGGGGSLTSSSAGVDSSLGAGGVVLVKEYY